ncbi:MAG: hypothetical protein G01um101466_34 [Parcubacteria group bacterium Gr01-1014_66]|nr:MAG: hypothetical protein G01um101466_34 [Parcubacteria group bacterium Gr01-1014_66]
MHIRFIGTLFISLLLVSFAAGGFFWVSRHIVQLNTFFRTAATEIAEAKEIYTAAHAQELLLKERGADIARIEALLIDPKKPITLIEHLEILARATKNKMELAVSTPPKKTKKVLAFTLRLHGTHQGVLTMLRAIELLPYPLRIEEATLQQQADTSLPVSTLLTALLLVDIP